MRTLYINFKLQAQVLRILKEEMLAKLATAKGFLLDGYPRAIDQAATFDKEVCPIQHVIYINVPDDMMKARLLKRGETSGRSDDNEATIAKRLLTYHKETEPVIAYYEKQKKVRKVGLLYLVSRIQACKYPPIFFKLGKGIVLHCI